jgi:hypothetical protein
MKRIGDASTRDQCGRRCFPIFWIVSFVFFFFRTEASSLDTIYMAITPGKNFQHVISRLRVRADNWTLRLQMNRDEVSRLVARSSMISTKTWRGVMTL